MIVMKFATPELLDRDVRRPHGPQKVLRHLTDAATTGALGVDGIHLCIVAVICGRASACIALPRVNSR